MLADDPMPQRRVVGLGPERGRVRQEEKAGGDHTGLLLQIDPQPRRPELRRLGLRRPMLTPQAANRDPPYRQWALKNSSLGVPSASKTACEVTWKLADEPSAFVSLPFNVNVVSAFPKAVPVSVIAPLLPNQTV